MPTLSKKSLSLFLRIGCERQFVLSLYSAKAERTAAGMPTVQPNRAGLGLVRKAGFTYQQEKVRELASTFGSADVRVNAINKNGQPAPFDLQAEINTLKPYQFLVEATYDANTTLFKQALGMVDLRDHAGRLLEISKAQPDLLQVLPPLSETLIPDVDAQRDATRFGVEPDGSLTLLSNTDTRLRLRIIDVKLASEPGAHYFAEVVYYAMTLSAWLREHALDGQFVVIAAPAVWPGNYSTSALSLQLAEWRTQAHTPSPAELAHALEADLEVGDVEVFAPRLRKLLSDTLPALLHKDWRLLDWHVDYRCKGCELLGYPKPKHRDNEGDAAANTNQPEDDAASTDLCWPTAEREKRLSRVVGLTRGASAQLVSHQIADVPRLALEPVASSVFDVHQGLRAKRTAFPHRAAALISTAASPIPDSGGDALMPRWPNLHVHLFVDYDLSTAITAAIGVRAFWVEPLPFASPFKGASQKQNWPDKGLPEVFLVDSQDLKRDRERQEFLKFLRHLRGIFNDVIAADARDVRDGRRDNKTTHSTYQIYLWDEAQRKHLVRLMGRYLADVLADSALRDLAWLFPPPELLQSAEDATRRSPFTIVSDVINNTLAVPVAHHYRLIDVAREYAAPLIHPTPVIGKNGLPLDPYFLFDLYQEPMSDLTPSERIHEWWARQGAWSETQDRIKRTSQTKVMALGDIVSCLEKTLDGKLSRQAAPPLGASRRNVSRLAQPSRLLWEFTRLNVALDELETDRIRAMPPYERAARGKSARLNYRLEGAEREAALRNLNVISDNPLAQPDELLIYKLKPDSFEINARPGDFGYALSPESQFGFLDQNAASLLKNAGLDADGVHFRQTVAEAKFTAMTIEAIDRVNGVIALRPDRAAATVMPVLEGAGMDFARDVILDPIHEDFLKAKLELTLQGIGNPPIAANATPSSQILATPPTKANKAPDSEAAQLLWNAPAVYAQAVARDMHRLQTQLSARLTSLDSGLDASQWAAWRAALSRRLTLVWGPPGTGKSHTLRAIVMGALLDAINQGRPLRLLVTAHTYTAIDNVLLKLGRDLGNVKPSLPVGLYRIQSKWRKESPDFAKQNPNVTNLIENAAHPSAEIFKLVAELNGPKSLNVIGCSPQQLHNVALTGVKRSDRKPEDTLKPWFDLIILDEASQMDVANATLVLTKLAPDGALVLAGDDLQLPPIHAAEPPEGLENEVGSVYNYFRRRHNIEPNALDVNYRSNRTIVELTRKAGYNPRLHSASPDLLLDLLYPLPVSRPDDWPAGLFWTPEWGRLLDPAQAVTCFVYEDKLSGQVNEFEASAVSALAWLMRNTVSCQLANELGRDGQPIPRNSLLYSPEQFWGRGLGIVTPHRAQMAKVVQHLQTLFPIESRNIRQAVDTVERFQGQERDVVIGSFGLGDPDVIAAEDEFLYSLRRFNVLISRPRAKLILFVTYSLLDHLSNDKDVLEESRLLKLAVESFASKRTPVQLGHLQNGRVCNISGWLHSA